MGLRRCAAPRRSEQRLSMPWQWATTSTAARPRGRRGASSSTRSTSSSAPRPSTTTRPSSITSHASWRCVHTSAYRRVAGHGGDSRLLRVPSLSGVSRPTCPTCPLAASCVRQAKGVIERLLDELTHVEGAARVVWKDEGAELATITASLKQVEPMHMTCACICRARIHHRSGSCWPLATCACACACAARARAVRRPLCSSTSTHV